jgi:hypothetical protein
LQRRGQSKAHARDLLHALLRDIDATDGQAPRNERKTFAELCDYFEKHYVKAAEYVDGRKVAAVRSLGTAKGQLKVYAIISVRAACVQLPMVTFASFARTGSHKRHAQRHNELSPASTGSFQCFGECLTSPNVKAGFFAAHLPPATQTPVGMTRDRLQREHRDQRLIMGIERERSSDQDIERLGPNRSKWLTEIGPGLSN